MIKHIEVIVTNVEEAIAAEQYGATRLELIHGFDLGGLTPDLELARNVCNAVSIPVNVMIRPQGHSFIFSQTDMKTALNEVDFILEQTQANAIVFGTLDNNLHINTQQLEQIIQHISGSNLELTFHRAIDASYDVVKSFHELVTAYPNQVNRVLSSGGKPAALDGAVNLAKMQQIAINSPLKLLAGSGITPHNAAELIQLTQVEEIHLGTGLRINNTLAKDKFDQLINNIS